MATSATKSLIRWQPKPALSCVVVCAVAGLIAVQGTPLRAQTPKQAPNQAAKKTEAAQKADVSRTQALALRVEQLEEQIVDLQVVIGTLESLAKPGGKSTGAAFTNGRASSGKSTGNLEAQVNALSLQVSKLSAEVGALQQGRAGRPIASGRNAAPAMGPTLPAGGGTQPGTSIGSGFGATTVSPSQVQGNVAPDQIGSLIREPMPPVANTQKAPPPQVAVTPPSNIGTAAAKATYELAYGNLLQQDYAAAQAGFRGFLRKYPEHTLVPNALYWLGETYYVQQNYTDAAEAFDIVTAAYAGSNKAPDSQLKRGMSLANLGKRSEACTVLGSLSKRYPNAPEHVKSKADSERQRVGCS